MSPLIESNHITNYHRKAASQSYACELGSLVMTRGSETRAREEKGGVKMKKKRLTMRSGACPDSMAGQCPRGRLDATRGRLHRSTAGSTTTALPPACTHTSRPLQACTACPKKKSGEGWRQRRQRSASLSEIQTSTSSRRKRPLNRFGGGGRRCWGEHFALGGDGDGHRRRPERPGDGGGDTVRQRGDGGEREGRPGLGWTDPDPSQLVKPARWAGRSVGPGSYLARWAEWNIFSFYQFDLIQNSNLNSNANFFLNSNQTPNLKYL
jgi:hypothetical protein